MLFATQYGQSASGEGREEPCARTACTALIRRDLDEYSYRSLLDFTSLTYLICKAIAAKNTLLPAIPAQCSLLTCAISRFHFGVAVQK